MDKLKIMQIFEEVLNNWEISQSHVINDTFVNEGEYDYEELERDVEDYRMRFKLALQCNE